jgi:hypothetical protein
MSPLEATRRYAAQVQTFEKKNRGNIRGGTLVGGSATILIYNLIDTISDLHNWHGVYDTPAEAMVIARQIVPLILLAAAHVVKWRERRQVWSDERRLQTRLRT